MDNGASSYRRFLDGDENGIVELIKEYKDGLILFLNGCVKNIRTAEELTEETFIKLYVNRPRFSGRCAFKTWLYTIGRNIAFDFLKKERGAALPIDGLENVLRDEENIEKTYLRDENRIAVHKALKNLRPEYRQILYLVFFEGFDNAEAAKLMKKSKRQIENLVYRSKISLKSELEKEGFVYEEL